jgi:para-nitrobenzyl esterase
LNVWTLAKRHTTGLPVLVYFYGGGFVAGDGSEPRYDGASMAAQGIVAVTVNYRLAIFGSFAHPELSAEASYKASGNYGLLDQSAALKWVHDNIAAFGGDPKKITIAGESAGSMSVSVQMASPLSRDYVAGAIGESGSAISRTITTVPLAEAEKQGAEFAQKAGNFTLAQLRAMSTREIFEIYQESKRWGFPPVLDGYLLPKPVSEIYAAGEQAQVPLLVGWNSAEIPGMAFVQAPTYTEEGYLQKLREAYPEDFETVLKLYPAGSPQEIERSATALASDRFIAYSTWKWFDLHRKHSSQPTYRYLYARIPPSMPPEKFVKAAPAMTMPPPIGAPHACEIEYCMGNLDLLKDTPWTADDYTVSGTMQTYFANFIKTGNPNGASLPEWPAAAAQDPAPPVMQIDVQSKAAPSTVEARYQFLDRSLSDQ